MLLRTALVVFAATNSPDGYLVKNWTTADGIPHNTVRAIIESSDGYLWLGTANGLARFDGVRFTVFDLANTSDLISDNIFSLHEDRQGTLWVRTRGGLARRRDGRFEFLSPTNGVYPSPFGSIAEEANGTLWFRGENGLGRWSGDHIEAVRLSEGGPQGIVFMRAAAEGGLWLAATNGLWRFQDGRAQRVDASPSPELLSVGSNGQLWGVVDNRRLFTLRHGLWQQMAEVRGEICSSLYAAPNGDVWMGSDQRNAAFRWRDGELTVVHGEQGLEGNRVLAFAQDNDGNMWLGLNAGGLFRLRERRVRMLDRRHGFEGLNTSSITEVADGSMMVNVMGSKLHRVVGDRVQPIAIASAGGSFDLTAIAPARAGGVWAGTFYGGLARIVDGREVERIGSSNGTRTLLVDRDGRLWRGTRAGGVEVFAGTNVLRYTPTNGLSFRNVYCLAQDRDGAIWAGTEQGLNRIQDGRVTVFGQTHGLNQQYISTLCVDSRGTLWVGTLGGGLSAWTGSNFVTLTTHEGLAHDAVDQLIEDDFDHLWLGTRLGLMRLSVAQLHEFIAGRIRFVTGTLVGQDEGLFRANLWTEYQPASAKARDGRLWFCTGSGVAVLDPRRFEKPAAAPVVHIEEVKTDGRGQLIEPRSRAAIVVPAGGERIEIRYTGISPSEPAQVRFRYQLVGYDRDWVEAGRSRVAGYSHLPPQRYEFRLKAVNNDGVWNEAEALLAIIVQPAWWQTDFFRVGIALLMAATAFGAYRLRIAQVERRRAAQEAFSRQILNSQEQERQRIAGELHDSLGQNLLVIKNRAALALTQQGQPEKMVAQINEVSTMASAAIREVREIAQNLRPFQIDELGLSKAIAAMARQLGDSSGIEFKTDLKNIDHALPPEFEINFYRIVQECLNNVVKHSQAKSASIQLRHEAREIRLTVRDDGRGFLAAAHQESQGFGLKNITERARTMGGEVQVQSRLGEGTRVEVTIPAH